MSMNKTILIRVSMVLGAVLAAALLWFMLQKPVPETGQNDPDSNISQNQDIAPPNSIGAVEPTQKPSAPTELTYFPKDRIFGQWRSVDPAFTFAIVPAEKQNSREDLLEIHSQKRVWRGWFEKDPINPVRAQVFYKPQAAEMNDALPPWVRRKIDGELEWRLELTAKGPDHHPYMELRWYRGFIEWDDKSRTAKIKEDDSPLLFELHYSPSIQITQNAPVSIRILPVADPDAPTTPAPLASVLQQQKFNIEVVAPYRMLETLGGSIEVSFKGKQSGSETSITLEPRFRPGDVGKRVVYTNQKPVKLSQCLSGEEYEPPTFTIGWFYSLKAEGPCLPFSGVDGEIVSVNFNEAVYRFQWWKNWMSAAIAAHRDEIERRRIVYSSIVTDSSQTDDLRKIAQSKITMIRNYDALMASDRLFDPHKVAIGDIYLGGKGIGSFLTYAGVMYGERIPPGKGLMSFTEKETRNLVDGNVRWPTYEMGTYVNSLVYFSEIISLITLDFDYNDNAGKRAAEAIPTDVDDQLPDKDTDPLLKSQIVWTSRQEQAAVSTAVKSVSAGLINEYSEAFFTQGTMLLYDGIAEESGAGFLFISADWVLENSPAIMQGLEDDKWPQLGSPRNHRGQPIDGWGIAASASNFLLNFAVNIDRAADGFSTMRFMSRQPLGADIAVKGGMPWRTFITNLKSGENVVTLSQNGGSFAAVLKNGDVFAADLPASVSKAARKRMSTQFVPSPLTGDGGVSRKIASDLSPSSSPSKQAGSIAPINQSADAAIKLPSKNSVVAGAGQVELALPLAAAQGKRLSVKKSQTLGASDIANDYGAGSKALTPIGSVLPAQQAKHSDGVIAANYALARDGGLLRSESVGNVAMQDVLINAAGRNEVAPAAAYYFGHKAPYPDAYLNQFMASRGTQGASLSPARNKSVRLIDAHLANEQGWTVTARMDFADGYTRQVVIEKIGLGGDGVPNKVTIFDPKYGTRIEVDALGFDKKLARNSDESLFKATRRNDPDLRKTQNTPNQVKNFVAPAPKPSAAKVLEFTKAPTANVSFSYIDKSTGAPMRVELGEFLGQGSTSQAYRHGENANLVVRINNPIGTVVGTEILTIENIVRAQVLDDMGRQALRAAEDSKHIKNIPFVDSTTMPDGRRIELVGFAKGEAASSLLSARGKTALSADELKNIDLYQEKLRSPNTVSITSAQEVAGKAALAKSKNAAKFSTAESTAIAQATLDLNKKGYVVLDGHRHNFNIVKQGNDIKVEFIDPGGIVPVKGLSPATARQVQSKVLTRSKQEILDFQRRDEVMGFWEGERRVISESIKDDIDFDALLTGPAYIDWENIPFKPSLGYENPEIARAFNALTGG